MIVRLPQIIILAVIRAYRVAISPLIVGVFGPLARCRFTPTCSAYAMEAVRVHGAWQGTLLTVRRLARCHPWGDSGWDPVPGTPEAEGRECDRRARLAAGLPRPSL